MLIRHSRNLQEPSCDVGVWEVPEDTYLIGVWGFQKIFNRSMGIPRRYLIGVSSSRKIFNTSMGIPGSYLIGVWGFQEDI